MKKIFLLLFSLLLSANVYAMSAEILGKGGIVASPCLGLDSNVYDVDLGFTLGAEAYLFPWKHLGFGAGVTHLFNTDVENTGKKMSFTNVYFSVKPKIIFNKDITALYFLGQVGLSNADIKIVNGDCSPGVYAAVGGGIEADWFIAEITYSYTSWALSHADFNRAEFYTLSANIGYKFSFEI